MRVWDGTEGTANAEVGHVVNTSGDDLDMTYMPHQADDIPQAISPVFFSQHYPRFGGSGDAGSEVFGAHHPLFLGAPSPSRPDGVIRVMPDHGHEGMLVTIQDTVEETVWPKNGRGYQPLPKIVAMGVDKGTGKDFLPIPLVSVYDGQAVGVGRIVAHTTWHHFINVNLYGLPATGGDNWVAITQYYLNLVWWLKPHAARSNHLQSLLALLALTPTIRALNGAPLRLLGKAAYQLLGSIATPGQIQDLVHLAVEQVIPPDEKQITSQRPLPPIEYLLGGLVAEEVSAREENREHHLGVPHGEADVATQGIHRALRARLDEVEASLNALRYLARMD